MNDPLFPKISIVTPSYNQAEFLEDAILSVLNQNYPNLEYIVMDGGSTDGSVDILKKYDKDLAYWVSEPDEGQSDALNRGFEMATGDIIGWLNADDYYYKKVFFKVQDLLSSDNIDAVYSNCTFVDVNKNYMRDLISLDPIKWLMLFCCYIPSTTFFFKRKIIEAGINIDKNFHLAMDKEFFAHILYSDFRLKYVDDSFAAFRWHSSNKSIEEEARVTRIKEGLKIYNRYGKFKVPETKIYLKIYQYAIFIASCYRFAYKKRASFKKKLAKYGKTGESKIKI